MFTNTADIKAFFRALPLPTLYLELTSGAGIITESHARSEIARLIADGSERTSTFAIAGELSLDPRAVERLLPSESELGGWGRVGAAGIVRPKELEELRKLLQEEVVLDTREFCGRVGIDRELLWRLLPAEWSWLGEDTVVGYGKKVYEDAREAVVDCLKQAAAPVALATLDSLDAPAAFVRKVVADVVKARELDGVLEGGRYVPDVYIQARQVALVEELREDGVIAVEDLRRERVTDPKGFVTQHVPQAQLLIDHFVMPVFMARTKNLVAERVERHGWSDIKAPEKLLPSQDETVLRQILIKSLPGVHEVAGLIVSNSLEEGLKAKCRVAAQARAENAWKRRGKAQPTDKSIKWQEIWKTAASEKSLNPTLLSHFSNTLTAYAKAMFEERYEEIRQAWVDSSRTAFMEKYHARLCIHLSGLDSVKDASLKSKLAVDLVEFARENGITAVEKLEVALREDPNVNLQPLQDLRSALQKPSAGRSESYLKEIEAALHKINPGGSIRDMALKAKKLSMMEEINSQLQSSKDISLTLLSTVLLLLAANSDGVIKATGKYVPKLLKEVQNAGIGSDTQIAAMSRMKAAAVGKGDVSDADVAELKSIGQQCVGDAADLCL